MSQIFLFLFMTWLSREEFLSVSHFALNMWSERVLNNLCVFFFKSLIMQDLNLGMLNSFGCSSFWLLGVEKTNISQHFFLSRQSRYQFLFLEHKISLQGIIHLLFWRAVKTFSKSSRILSLSILAFRFSSWTFWFSSSFLFFSISSYFFCSFSSFLAFKSEIASSTHSWGIVPIIFPKNKFVF